MILYLPYINDRKKNRRSIGIAYCNKKESGAVVVEFCISVGLFFFLNIVFLELLYTFFLSLSLQFVASRAMRSAVIGPLDQETAQVASYDSSSYALYISHKLANDASNFGVTLLSENIFVCPVKSGTVTCSQQSAAEPGELMTIYIRLKHPIFVYLKELELSSLAVGKMQRF